MTMVDTPRATPAQHGQGPQHRQPAAAKVRGRTAGLCVAGFLVALLPFNTFWALGGTWGLGWILGCADCTVPLALVWAQEVLLVAGIAIVLARLGLWRAPLPQSLWRLGLGLMTAAFGLVGASNLLGDNTIQARFLFAPAALGLAALSGVANRRLPAPRMWASRPAPPPPPRWARRAAVLAVLTPIPSALWRMAMAVGVPLGVDDSYRRNHYGFPGWGTLYVFGLSFLLVGLALLTLGLVRPWGEVVPQWIPWIGGRPVRPLAAVIPAATGALALALLWTSVFLFDIQEIFVIYGLDGFERVVVGACYTPFLLWGPLLAAVTASYARRHLVRCSLAAG